MASAPCEAAVQVLAQAASPKRPPGVAEADADPLVGGVLGQVELLGQESLRPSASWTPSPPDQAARPGRSAHAGRAQGGWERDGSEGLSPE